MDLRHLRHFVAVAEERHFGRAAARLGIEQSPLSRSIRHLEGQLETALLERGSRGSQLTQAGTALLPEARAILAQVARLKSLAAAKQAISRLRLRLGVCDAVATIRLGMCLSALRERHPNLAVEVVPLDPTEAINAKAPIPGITQSADWPSRNHAQNAKQPAISATAAPTKASNHGVIACVPLSWP